MVENRTFLGLREDWEFMERSTPKLNTTKSILKEQVLSTFLYPLTSVNNINLICNEVLQYSNNLPEFVGSLNVCGPELVKTVTSKIKTIFLLYQNLLSEFNLVKYLRELSYNYTAITNMIERGHLDSILFHTALELNTTDTGILKIISNEKQQIDTILKRFTTTNEEYGLAIKSLVNSIWNLFSVFTKLNYNYTVKSSRSRSLGLFSYSKRIDSFENDSITNLLQEIYEEFETILLNSTNKTDKLSLLLNKVSLEIGDLDTFVLTRFNSYILDSFKDTEIKDDENDFKGDSEFFNKFVFNMIKAMAGTKMHGKIIQDPLV